MYNRKFHADPVAVILPLCLAALCLLSPAAFGQAQPPISIICDMHADPLPQTSYAEKLAYYSMQLDYGIWAVDRAEPLGVEISFLACGEFMEFVVQEGPAGSGALFLQRIYGLGEQIGSHSHSEYRLAAFDWPSFPSNATYFESVRSWQDNIDWVSTAIETALGSPPPKPLSEINAVKGAHLPATEDQYHDLMSFFGLEVREGGAEEDYYGFYNHHIMNPFRPAVDNYMGEDLSAPFVAIPQGAVIGKAAIHHGIFQDMTAPNVKRMFIQTYLNWRYNDRHGLMDRIWVFGWGSHNHDYMPGSRTRADFAEMIEWLNDNFVGKADRTGSVISQWNTQIGAADDYFAWETSHPGVSSFDSNGTHLDWGDYRYLRAVCVELWEARHTADLDLGAGITAWHLTHGPKNIVVAFSDAGPTVLDLSSMVSAPCRIVGAESGLLLGMDPAQVLLDGEPLIVTEIAPQASLIGTPAIGETVFLQVRGEPDAMGRLFLSRSPASIDVPHFGTILVDTSDGFRHLGSGPMTGGTFTRAVPIPNDPGLVGETFYIQGLEERDNGSTLTVNSLEVTIL